MGNPHLPPFLLLGERIGLFLYLFKNNLATAVELTIETLSQCSENTSNSHKSPGGEGGGKSMVIHMIENARMYVMLIIATCSAFSMVQPSWEEHT